MNNKTLFLLLLGLLSFSGNSKENLFAEIKHDNLAEPSYSIDYQLKTLAINDKDAKNLIGLGTINTMFSEHINYGYEQFKALNGLKAKYHCINCQPFQALPIKPVWLNWKTLNSYLKSKNLLASANRQSQAMECNDEEIQKEPYKYRYLSVTEVPDSSLGKKETLRDSSGNLIHYQVVLSPKIEAYLNSIDINEQTEFNFPSGKSNEFGSMAIKLAWKEIQGDDGERYFKQHAYISDQGACRKAIVALIAMHFAYKTENQQQWVWTTFSHIDNAPPAKIDARDNYEINTADILTKKWNLYDRYSPSDIVGINKYDAQYSGYNSKIGNISEFNYSQYYENFTISPNESYRSFVSSLEKNFPNTPWIYYMQDATQWAQKLDSKEPRVSQNINNQQCTYNKQTNTCDTPIYLSNAAIEPYNQQSSCIGCHRPSNLRDPKTLKNKFEYSKDFMFFPNLLINSKVNSNDHQQ